MSWVVPSEQQWVMQERSTDFSVAHIPDKTRWTNKHVLLLVPISFNFVPSMKLFHLEATPFALCAPNRVKYVFQNVSLFLRGALSYIKTSNSSSFSYHLIESPCLPDTLMVISCRIIAGLSTPSTCFAQFHKEQSHIEFAVSFYWVPCFFDTLMCTSNAIIEDCT